MKLKDVFTRNSRIDKHTNEAVADQPETDSYGGESHVHIVEAPNNIEHRFYVVKGGIVTETPHIELMGHDISKFRGETELMDEATQELYGCIQALNQHISSISILADGLEVNAPVETYRKTWSSLDYIRGNWKPDLDARVIDCLAKHLGLQDAPYVTRERKTEDEVWKELNFIIASAQADGIAPPPGWGRRRSSRRRR